MRNNKLYKRMIAATTTVAMVAGSVAPIATALAEEEKQDHLISPAPTTLDSTIVPPEGVTTGWVWMGGAWFYFKDGAAYDGWLVDPDYANAVFYLEQGVMATDWKFIDGDWYFFGTSGRRKQGWIWSDEYAGWYYLNEGTDESKPYGAMLRNTTAKDGSYVDANGRWTMTAPTPVPEVEVKGTYSYHIHADDWGPAVDSVILALDTQLNDVSASDFKVSEHKQVFDWANFAMGEDTVERKVIDAQFVGENGIPANGPTKFVMLDLEYDPNTGSPLVFSGLTFMNTWSNPYELNISLSDESTLKVDNSKVSALTINPEATGAKTDADDWQVDNYEAKDGVKYKYATWDPQEESDTLVVWLHGIGEGGTEGTDPILTVLGNEVTALARQDFQSTIGGAHLLVPECPTFWMDNKGDGSNFSGGGIQSDGTSYYLNSLEEFIDSYAAKIGAKKIVLAGCSNGGYMSLLLAMHRPEAYAAAVLSSEAVEDEDITDEQIQAVKDLPMYFIYSRDDTTVIPEKCEEPTIERLREAGAPNLYVSTSEHVVDKSGRYKDAEGNPHQYDGHWSWVYFFNNEAQDDNMGLTSWDFIADAVSDKAVARGYLDANILGDDWGCGINKLQLNLDTKLDSVDASSFVVTETKEAIDWTDPNFASIEATSGRTIKDAYLVTEAGEKTTSPSTHVAIELEISPSEGSPFVWSPKTFYNTFANPLYINVTKGEAAKLTSDGKEVGAIRVNHKINTTTNSASMFDLGEHETESGITYQFGEYRPAGGSDTLVVWLHGMGEGQGADVDAGNTPLITLLGNKVTALAGDEFQTKIGGANVLVPQAPTYWMDKDGTAANKLTRLDSDGSSFYQESLEQLIDWYAKEVGAKKIVLTGASNGGYMVLNLAIHRPDAYAAVVPISETIQDKYLTDEDIAKLAKVPLFFVYCNADTTAVAANCSIPTIERLKAAGATADSLKWSSSEQVTDTSGRFKNEDGTPYTYSGHWAWVYFDNDETADDTDGTTTAWDFIANAVK